MSTIERPNNLNRQLKGLIFSLIVEFVLGATLTTLVSYDPTKRTTTQTVLLLLHILVAVGIVVGGSFYLVLSIRRHQQQTAALIGLASSIGAFISGSIAARGSNDIAVFIMAVCFIVALSAYGFSLLKTNATRPASQ